MLELALEASVEVGEGAAGAAEVVVPEVPGLVCAVGLATGGVDEVGYSLSVEGEMDDDGAPVAAGGAPLDVEGGLVDERVALGPGTSTWTFGGAPSGCGITTIGPTCTGPTVTGAGSWSAAAGEVEGVPAGDAVVES